MYGIVDVVESPSDLDITIVPKNDIEDAIEGLPGNVGGETNGEVAPDELSVLTGEEATSLLELVGSDPVFKKIKDYCESKFDAEFPDNNIKTLEHNHLKANYSTHFIANINNNKNNGSVRENLNIVAYITDDEVLGVVAFHEHNKHEDITEIRVIRRTEDGFKEYVVEHTHTDELFHSLL